MTILRLITPALLALLLHSASAQLPSPRLSSVFPAGARIGSTTELTLAGSDLDESSRLAFSRPGLVATPVPGAAVPAFRVAIPTNAAPGLVEVRVIGRFGASNPRLLALATNPEVTSPTTNLSAATAFGLPLDTTCNGRMPASQAQWFRFQARSGQRIIARLQARELDSRLVPDLVISTADGRELASSRRISLLDFSAPADGTYWLQLHDQTYRGGDDYFYRLTLETGPLAEFIVPQVLQAGVTNHVTVYGRNLPGSAPAGITGADGRPLERLELDLPPTAIAASSAPMAGLPRRPAASAIAGNLLEVQVPLGSGTFADLRFGSTTNPVFAPVCPAAAPTNTPPLVAVSPPCDFGGLFPARGELSGVTFSAKKDEVLWIEVVSERLGHNADPRLLVQRLETGDQGREHAIDVLELNDLDNNPGGREFDISSRDVSGRFQAPQDGTYRVLVRDLFQGAPPGRRLPYWLALRRESPDFHLAAFPQPQPRLNDADRQVHLWSTVLRRGETQPVKVIAFRQDGFDGEIELTATNLPPGVTATAARISSGSPTASLFLTAAPGAKPGACPITIVGRANIGGKDRIQHASAGTLVWQIPDWDQERSSARPAADLCASVCGEEAAPVIVVPVPARALEVASGAKLSLSLDIQRTELFPAAFNLKFQGHPEAQKWKDVAVAEKATNAVVEIAPADNKLPPGTHTLWLQAFVPGKYRNNPEALAVAEEELKAAAAKVAALNSSTDASPTAEAKAAAEELRKAAEAKRKAAEERAKPRDLTLAVYSQPITLKVLPAQEPRK